MILYHNIKNKLKAINSEVSHLKRNKTSAKSQATFITINVNKASNNDASSGSFATLRIHSL